jgi:hypothetical protein
MGFMRPKVSSAPAPPPPTIEDTAGAQQDYQDALRRRRGRAASILTDRNQAAPQTASKQLLGQ